MERYYIKTWNFEGSMVYEYGYTQWKEIIKNFRSVGRSFEAWIVKDGLRVKTIREDFGEV